MSSEKGMGILLMFVGLALVFVSGLALSAEVKVKELRLELRRVNLDRGGLNGLCKALIEQKYNPPYSTFAYGLILPDGMTVEIEINHQKDYILSQLQRYKLVRFHKEAIAKITHEEWTSYKAKTKLDITKREIAEIWDGNIPKNPILK